MTSHYDEATKGPHSVLELGDVPLESGETLREARLLYKTHGEPNAARDNAILYPHMYSGTPSSLESTIAPGRALDPERLLRRSAPGSSAAASRPRRATRRQRSRRHGRRRRHGSAPARHRDLWASTGWPSSPASRWARSRPTSGPCAIRPWSNVSRRSPAPPGRRPTTPSCCASPKRRILEAPTPEDGLRRHAHVWAATGLSTELFRTEAWRDCRLRVGRRSRSTPVRGRLRADASRATWSACAASGACSTSRGMPAATLAAALARITARTFVIPFSNDSLFPVADCRSRPGAHRGQRPPRDREPVGPLVVGDDRDRQGRPGRPARASSSRGPLLASLLHVSASVRRVRAFFRRREPPWLAGGTRRERHRSRRGDRLRLPTRGPRADAEPRRALRARGAPDRALLRASLGGRRLASRA